MPAAKPASTCPPPPSLVLSWTPVTPKWGQPPSPQLRVQRGSWVGEGTLGRCPCDKTIITHKGTCPSPCRPGLSRCTIFLLFCFGFLFVC